MIVSFALLLGGGKFVVAAPFPLDTIIVSGGTGLEKTLKDADAARLNYDFPTAVKLYEEALDSQMDDRRRKSIEKSLYGALAGETLQSSCLTPTCVARNRFSKNEFHLYYPLSEGGWHPLPSVVDSSWEDLPFKAVYFPQNQSRVVFSSHSEDGGSDLYETFAVRDTSFSGMRSPLGPADGPTPPIVNRVWTAPTLLGEDFISSDNEILPILSRDGKKLYFSSDGMDSMGGYDLFVSEWDDEKEKWGKPRNMGFPYSSPYNDYLVVDTSDGKYRFFASDRSAPADSVYIYVVGLDSEGEEVSLFSPEDLRALCLLDPGSDSSFVDNSSSVMGMLGVSEIMEEFTRLYSRFGAILRSNPQVRDEVSALRTAVRSSEGAVRDSLRMVLDSLEEASGIGRSSYRPVLDSLRLVEGVFLSGRGSVGRIRGRRSAAEPILDDLSGFTFSRRNTGRALSVEFLAGEPSGIFRFSSGGASRQVEDFTTSDGLLYRIRLFSSRVKVKPEDLGALSPIFQEELSGGRYMYYAGEFGYYQEALSCLTAARAAGYPTAMIIPYLEGEEVSVETALQVEKEIRDYLSSASQEIIGR